MSRHTIPLMLSIVALVLAIVSIIKVVTGTIPQTAFNANASHVEFKVLELKVVDFRGYPSLQVKFSTSKYPLIMKLVDEEGLAIDKRIVEVGESVAILHLTRDRYENIIDVRKYVLYVYTPDNKLAYKQEIEVRGKRPIISIEKIVTCDDILKLKVHSIAFVVPLADDYCAIVRVRNVGETPLYIVLPPGHISEELIQQPNVDVVVDNKPTVRRYQYMPVSTLFVVEPLSELILAVPLNMYISREFVEKEHIIEIRILNTTGRLTIPALKPSIEVLNISIVKREVKGDVVVRDRGYLLITLHVKTDYPLPVPTWLFEIKINDTHAWIEELEPRVLPPYADTNVKLKVKLSPIFRILIEHIEKIVKTKVVIRKMNITEYISKLPEYVTLKIEIKLGLTKVVKYIRMNKKEYISLLPPWFLKYTVATVIVGESSPVKFKYVKPVDVPTFTTSLKDNVGT